MKERRHGDVGERTQLEKTAEGGFRFAIDAHQVIARDWAGGHEAIERRRHWRKGVRLVMKTSECDTKMPCYSVDASNSRVNPHETDVIELANHPTEG